MIRHDFDPTAIAQSYARAGATCLSVLTDAKYFQGSGQHLAEVRQAVHLPLLRKEFIVDPYQVVESRALGADCILLIAAALEDADLKQFSGLARELALDVLVEVHDNAELARVLPLEPALIGINNRNLKTFETRLETTFDLLGEIPDTILPISESGIHTREDVRALRARGVHAFLVGEAFMRSPDPGQALTALFG